MQSVPARSSDKLEVVRASPKCALGRFGGLVLMNWRSEATHEGMKAAVDLRNEMLTSGVFRGAVHVVEAGLPLPDESLRQAARRAIEARQDNRSAIALVILGEGFAASAIRSVGTAIFALRGAPTRLFASTAEAAKWMVEEMDAHEDAQALASACEALRAAG
jgi:hypothetical protein